MKEIRFVVFATIYDKASFENNRTLEVSGHKHCTIYLKSFKSCIKISRQ